MVACWARRALLALAIPLVIVTIPVGAQEVIDLGRWEPLGIDYPGYGFVAAWTGSEVLTYGAWSDGPRDYEARGRAFNPATNSARPLLDSMVFAGRTPLLPGIWTGQDWIILSAAGDGARYSPRTNSFTPVEPPVARPAGRGTFVRGVGLVWTDAEVLMWGSRGLAAAGAGVPLGLAYDPANGSWRRFQGANAPTGRACPAAVWTGQEMLVWGGADITAPAGGPVLPMQGGGRYDPRTDVWLPISLVDAPAPRFGHSAVWTGNELLVWGGLGQPDDNRVYPVLQDGGKYNPISDTWTAISAEGAPDGRRSLAVWTGKELIAWGSPSAIDGTLGARYDPALDVWAPLPDGGPQRRSEEALVWTGYDLLVLGGIGPGSSTSWRYRPPAAAFPDVPIAPQFARRAPIDCA